jgi:uncharacterized membrane protein YdjX (TVP38/TMEM64 family)
MALSVFSRPKAIMQALDAWMDHKRHSAHWKRRLRKAAVTVAAVAAVLLVVKLTTAQDEPLSLHAVQEGAARLKAYVTAFYLPSAAVFIISYVLLTLWFPAAAVLTLLGGYLFGTVQAVLFVAGASLTAALLTFWFSRYAAGEWIQHKWEEPLRKLNNNIDRFGFEYLIIIRLIPMMPFTAVNIVAGLTRVSVQTFAWTTFLGGLPGMILFSYFGRHLLDLQSVEEVITWKAVAAISLLIVSVIAILVYHYLKVKKSEYC